MRQCAVCGKGSVVRSARKLLRGHYNVVATTRKYPNLQKTKLATGERVLACVKCIKTLARKAP